MKKNIIVTSQAPLPVGSYSQAVRVENTLFCSGQIAIDPKTNEVFRGEVGRQTEIVMENIKALLKEVGLDFSHIIKTSVFLTDMDDFKEVNQVYQSFFHESFPARSCVAVSALPKGVNVEIEVIAHFQK